MSRSTLPAAGLRLEKVDAFRRISFARLDSASSARSLRFSAASSVASFGDTPAASRYLRTQTRREFGLMPYSVPILLEAVVMSSPLSTASGTSWIARSLSSWGNVAGMGSILSGFNLILH